MRDGDEIILITEGGKTIRMQVNEDQFRVMGRSTGGVKAIAVPEGDRLVSMAWVRPEADEEDLADDEGSAEDEERAGDAGGRRTRGSAAGRTGPLPGERAAGGRAPEGGNFGQGRGENAPRR